MSKKITELPAASAVNLTDVFEKVNDPSGTPESQKATVTQLRAAMLEGYFEGTVSTTDATVTSVYEFTPVDNKVVRVFLAAGIGVGSGVNCSFGKISSFKVVSGVVTQIGSVATIGSAEENSLTDCTVDTDGTKIRVRVTGVAATNMTWRAIGQVYYHS